MGSLPDVLGILARTSVAVILLSLWLATRRVSKGDGILYRSLATAWFWLAVPFWLHAVASLEHVTDVLPGVDILLIAQRWLWAIHACAAVAMGRFLYALRQQHPRRR